MWYPAEFVLMSYLPDKLEEGMLFINRISVGVMEPYIELFELKEIPEDIDEFMAKHGSPIKLFIIGEAEQILATPEEIGWWDEGEHVEDYREITLDDINFIIRELDGYVDIMIDDEEESPTPILGEGKVILSLNEEYDDDWDVTLMDGLEEE
jgi:hypothetical protein